MLHLTMGSVLGPITLADAAIALAVTCGAAGFYVADARVRAARRAGNMLAATAVALDTSVANLAPSLGVSAGELYYWRTRGVPRAHQAAVAELLHTARALRRSEVPAEVARRLLELRHQAHVDARAVRGWLDR